MKRHITGSKGEQRGNSSCLSISVSAVHVFVFVFSSYLLGLSVNHYLENVHIIMLVRFKLAEEWENWCTVKKKNVLLRIKALSV